MKQILSLVILISLGQAPRAFSSETPPEVAGPFYFVANGGVAWIENVSFRNASGSGTLRFDPGFRLDFAGGYQLTHAFGVEVETGLTCNRARGFNSDFFENDAVYLLQTPVLANVTYRIPPRLRLDPFIGAGIGGIYTSFENWSVLSDEHNGSDFTFGYQGFAGVRYELSRRTELGMAYKFMGTTGYELEHLGPTRSHSFTLSFSMRF